MVARKGKFNHLEVYIKQRDPLSPYISIICKEFLGRELAKQTKNRKRHRNSYSRNGPKLPFLMFAYDCVIFVKTSHNACINIKAILQKFCVLSSQLAHKSAMQISNHFQGATKRRLGEALNIPLSNNIGKCLSCPIIKGRIKRNSCSKVIDNSRKKPRHLGKNVSSQE